MQFISPSGHNVVVAPGSNINQNEHDEETPLLGGGAGTAAGAAGGQRPGAASSWTTPGTKPNEHRRVWSHTEPSSFLGDAMGSPAASSAAGTPLVSGTIRHLPITGSNNSNSSNSDKAGNKKTLILYSFVYALVNVIISVPGLYGYAAVIFNHPIFQGHMNALSKLVIFSSLVHQLSFVLFSSMPFAIGTVQDAGLIFLSSMSNAIADKMLADGASKEAVISTTMVLLSAGTALLGVVLIVIGKFKLANVVSYLPMPVVGGYLAFIGYFCIQAGTALCISQPLITFSDWAYLFQGQNMLLAGPGLLAALLLTYISRAATNDAILPLTMVAIPALFYIVIYITGAGLEGARKQQWVGDVAPPVPVSELFHLVDFTLVRWDCVSEIIWTWVGMIFVVSFASCLDVAAIAMDKGEALDTNRELATVGIGNLMSGLTFGYTGSYIFSQTIFTYRTGVHSRLIGILIMFVFFYIVVSPVNILQVAPLFFLGSTLIFIGYDLVYEWLIEIRPRVLMSEYLIIWGTFIAIQIIGVDFGIIVGVLVAILDNVVATAQTTSVVHVHKRSRAVWTPSENQILQRHGYHPVSPKIAVFEIKGPVFFGSSLALLEGLVDEVGIDTEQDNAPGRQAAASAISPMRSPHTSSHLLIMNLKRRQSMPKHVSSIARRPPQFVVIDLSQVSNMDASAARTCFLQFATMCNKKGIVVCASGATPRMDWMLRSHGVSYKQEEEKEIKTKILKPGKLSAFRQQQPDFECEKILLFLTTHEALEFCESALIHLYSDQSQTEVRPGEKMAGPYPLTMAEAFAKILHCSPEDTTVLSKLDGLNYHEEIDLKAGERVFSKGAMSSGFYVVLSGMVASQYEGKDSTTIGKKFFTGAGLHRQTAGSQSNLLDPEFTAKRGQTRVATLWPVCSVFGYSDFLLDRPYTFSATATQNGTRLARMDRSQMNLLANDPALDALVQRVLLNASIRDLQNCTCRDV